jgi:hypothetical protein
MPGGRERANARRPCARLSNRNIGFPMFLIILDDGPWPDLDPTLPSAAGSSDRCLLMMRAATIEFVQLGHWFMTGRCLPRGGRWVLAATSWVG